MKDTIESLKQEIIETNEPRKKDFLRFKLNLLISRINQQRLVDDMKKIYTATYE